MAVAVVGADAAAAQETPEAAALAFGEAIRANDWAMAARMMDPGALRQLRALFEPVVAAPDAAELAQQYFGVASGAEFAALPDTVLFARFLSASVSEREGVADALRTATLTPLGHVPQGPDTVLVVTRLVFQVEGLPISQFDVMPFRQDGGRWRGLLKADVTNLAALLQRAMGVKEN